MRARVIPAALLVLVGFATPAAAQSGEGRWVVDATTGCEVWVSAPLAADRISWSGGCQNRHAEGRGVMRRYAGDRLEAEYAGEYHEGRRDGRGAIRGANGVRYDGEWRNDQYEGRGAYQSPDGSRYEGDWHLGRPEGHGAWAYADGARYEGELREGEYRGRGVYTWPNGDRYEGGFRSDRPDGPGVFQGHDGKTFQGTWTLGCLKRGADLVAVLLTEIEKCR